MMRTLLCLVLLALVIQANGSGRRGRGQGRGRGRGWFWGRRGGWGWGWGRCKSRDYVNPDDVPVTNVERVSQERTVVGTCTVDVGTCPAGSCYYDPRLKQRKCEKDGYVCPVTKTENVDCGLFGTHEVEIVTSCTCCKDNGIIISGQVVSADQTPIAFAKVRTESKIIFSAYDGRFNFKVDSDTRQLVFRSQRYLYLPAIKVVDIPEGSRGPIDVEIVMIRQAESVEISASEDNELPVTSSFSSNAEPRAVIKIPTGSFKNRRGVSFVGNVSVSVNVIDPSSPDVETESPGRFLTEDGEPLISGGIFAISYSASQRLTLDVTVQVPAGMKLWKLSSDGVWIETGTAQRRRKRQAALTDEFLVNIDNGDWVNIDKIPRAPRCYFKARVFWETTNTEITSSATATFKPSVVGFTTQNQRMRLYHSATSTPAATCYEVRCPNISIPANLLVGVIGMQSFESVSVGGANIPVVSTLKPRPLSGYTAAIQPDHSAVEYEVIPTGDEVFVNFISSNNGPFYTSNTDCLSSTVTDPAFHFLKPDLPSYVETPNDTDICTARIGFFDSYNFYNVLNDLDSLPAVTATSTWSLDGNDYFYTYTTVMQFSTDSSNGSFVFLCIKYRCSTSNANTTVYLDIDIPVITINNTGEDLYNTTAFQCWGNCSTGNCHGQGELAQSLGIDGSFIAPVNISDDGPDFYMDSPNDCSQRTRTEAFAAMYHCYSRKQFEGNSSTRRNGLTSATASPSGTNGTTTGTATSPSGGNETTTENTSTSGGNETTTLSNGFATA